MENNNLSQKIVEAIKQQHIKPRPKWEFLLQNWLIWLFFLLAISIGSLAAAVSIFVLANSGWEDSVTIGRLNNFLINLPYFWLLILFVFLVVAYYNFRHTEKGYRYSTFVILGVGALVSLVLGSGVYAVGVGERLEDVFYRQVPIYRNIMHSHCLGSVNPQEGRLGAVIIGGDREKLIIRDFRGNIWEIPTSTINLNPGQRIKVFGVVSDGGQFNAAVIKPWFHCQLCDAVYR